MPMRFPFHVDGRGCTAATAAEEDEHIRDLIEQVLMTSPGERRNRPDFGCGLRAMVFAPGGDALQAALQASVQASLQRWLGERVQIQDVLVEVVDAKVQVTVVYVVRQRQQQQVVRFETETVGDLA